MSPIEDVTGPQAEMSSGTGFAVRGVLCPGSWRMNAHGSEGRTDEAIALQLFLSGG